MVPDRRLSVRMATSKDEEPFCQLWGAFIQELASNGGEILPTPKTFNFIRHLFREYTAGNLPGVVLILGNFEGGLLWGSPGELPYDTTCGAVAQAWGTYLQPNLRGQGYAGHLWELAALALESQGIDTIAVSPHSFSGGVAEGLQKHGFKPHQTLMLRSL